MTAAFERERVFADGNCRGESLLENEPKTLAELIAVAAQRKLDDALNFKRDGRWQRISSEEMECRAQKIALGLMSLGLTKGDKAAIMAANSPEWTLTDAGCQFSGIIDVPIYTTLAPDSIGYILRDSGARVILSKMPNCMAALPKPYTPVQQSKKWSFSFRRWIDRKIRFRSQKSKQPANALEAKIPESCSSLTSGKRMLRR